MAQVRKTSPIGIDAPIDKLQNYLYTKLGWTNYESYHRAYKNQKGNSLIPEVYTSNGDYKEIYFDDTFNATSFFLVDDIRDVTEVSLTTGVSLIYQVKLSALYPSISHRADEEVVSDITRWINLNSKGFDLVRVTEGVSNVYSGLNLEMPELTDMSDFFVVRFDMETKYLEC